MGEGVLNSRSSFNESDRENGCWPDLEMYRHNWTCCGHNLLCFDWFAYLTPLLCFAHLVFPFGLFPLFLFFLLFAERLCPPYTCAHPFQQPRARKSWKQLNPIWFGWRAHLNEWRIGFLLPISRLCTCINFVFLVYSPPWNIRNPIQKKKQNKKEAFFLSLSLSNFRYQRLPYIIRSS